MRITALTEGVGHPPGLVVEVTREEAIHLIETLATQMRKTSWNAEGKAEFRYSVPGDHPARDKRYFCIQVIPEESKQTS